MLDNRKLVLDTFCEVYDLIKHWADDYFWDLTKHTIVPGSLYLIGSEQFLKHRNTICQLVESNTISVALSNPAEGSATILHKIHRLGIADLVKQGKMFVISGGDIEPGYRVLTYDSFLPKLFDYNENVEATNKTDQIYTTTNKPYKFLFLNGRARYHRKYLLEHFQSSGLLTQSLWTNLDSTELSKRIELYNPLAPVPVKSLPKEYEVTRYRKTLPEDLSSGTNFKKEQVFNNEWGEIYLQPEPYIDTYFSLVTETVFDYPYSFRTEKIWKPIAIGHPWIAVANAGYYRDLRNLGFKTFDPIIDESFDLIDDNQKRIDRIIEVVTDLCSRDLDKFQAQCYTICKYNQQHLADMRHRVRKEFPDRFHQFINDINQ